MLYKCDNICLFNLEKRYIKICKVHSFTRLAILVCLSFLQGNQTESGETGCHCPAHIHVAEGFTIVLEAVRALVTWRQQQPVPVIEQKLIHATQIHALVSVKWPTCINPDGFVIRVYAAIHCPVFANP